MPIKVQLPSRRTRLWAVLLTPIVAFAALTATAAPANATPISPPVIASTQALVADGSQVQQVTPSLESELTNLHDGESFIWTAPAGEKVVFTNAGGTINVTGPLVFGPQVNSVGDACVLANVVAVGLFVLGAAAIAVLAFVTAGAGGAVVGGIFLTTAELGTASAVAGTFAGVLGFTSSLLC